MSKASFRISPRPEVEPRSSRQAARREGQSIGEWLQDVIAEHESEPQQIPSRASKDRAPRLSPGRFSAERDKRRRWEDAWEDADGSADDGHGFEDLIVDTLQAMERRAARSEKRTEDAFASLAHLLEETEARRNQERSAVGALSTKLSDIEAKLVDQKSAGADNPIRSALARLEARLDAIGQRSASEAAARTSALKLAAETDPAPALAKSNQDQLDRKLDAILAALGESAAPAHSQVSAAALTARTAAANSSKGELGNAIAEIVGRQRSLESEAGSVLGLRRRLEQDLQQRRAQPQPAQAEPQQPVAALAAMKSELATLASNFDAMRGELKSQRGQDVVRPKDVAAVRADIRQVSDDLRGLAPHSSLQGLQNAVKALDDKIAGARLDGLKEAVVGPVEAAVDGLRASLSALDPREAMASLQAEMRAVGDRLDDLATRDGDDVALVELRNQVDEIRSAFAACPPSLNRLEDRVAKLNERFERQVVSPMHDAGADGSSSLMVATDPAVLDTLTAIEARLGSLAQRVEDAAHHGEAAPDGFEGSALPLEAMLRELTVKIEAVQERDGGEQALEALQDQIAALSHRFERSEHGMATLSKLEASMQDLFEHLETTRASIEVSAARAARDAVRLATSETNGRDADRHSAEFAALHLLQEEADSRTQSTLGIVHATLEKVVDRLAAMESEVSGLRAPPVDAGRGAVAPSPQALATAPDAPTRGPRGSRLPSTLEARLGEGRPGPVGQRRDPSFEMGGDRAHSPARGTAGARLPSDQMDGENGRADFIAAARRAAKAAQNDPSVAALKVGSTAGDTRAGLLAKSRDFVATHKRPVLLSIAALFVLMGTLALMQRPMPDSDRQLAERAPATKVASLAPAASYAPDRLAAKRPMQAADLSPSALPAGARPLSPMASGAMSSPAPRSPLLAAPTMAGLAGAKGASSRPAPALSTPIPGSDPIQTGSIPSLPSFAQRPMSPMRAVAALPSGLQQAADAGNGAAEYELGTRYAEGRGVPRDFKLASDWYKKAADAKIVPAKYRLASLFEKGLGVPLDKAHAKSLYLEAAEAGNPRAMHNLAVLLADGDGKPDYPGAALWFRRAAQYGIRDSQYNLAILLARGLGVPQSLTQSYQWFAIAAKNDDPDAAKKRDDVGARLGDADLAAARALAAGFTPRVADEAAIEVRPPAGGWDGAAPASHLNSPRSKISMM